MATLNRNRPHLICTLVLAAAASAWIMPSAQEGPKRIDCRPEGSLVRVAELPEASGIAVGRRQRGRAWAHNDSGDPVLVALDDRGRVTGRVQITGATVEDWEAIAVGPCSSGSCLFIADIGDNDAERERVTVYRTPEPTGAGAATASVVAIHATYPDGSHDAETLIVSPKGEIFVVTKGESGPLGLYRFPPDPEPGSTVELERVGQPRNIGAKDRITDGAVSPDGAWVVLRTNDDLRFFPASGFFSGEWSEAARVGLERLGEPQGEGVAFAGNRTLLLAGEGGGKSQPGTFARVTCTF